MLLLYLILLISVIFADPTSPHFNSFAYRPSFFDSFSENGPIVSMRYNIRPRNVPHDMQDYDYRGKLWCVIQILSEDHGRQRLRLTVVRLDNQMDKFNQKLDFKYRYADPVWRDVSGWPDELVLTISSHGSRQITVPANPHNEILQMDFDGDGMRHVVNVDRDIPKRIFQVTTNRKGQYKPLLHKCATLSRIMNPNWDYRGISVDQIKPAAQLLKETKALMALNTLRPVAYQIDLFRLLILYHFGGVYTDTRLTPIVSFEEILPKTGGLIVVDADPSAYYNAFLALPKHSSLAKVGLIQIITNVQNRYYGPGPLYPTGPHALAKAFNQMLTEDQKREYVASIELCHDDGIWIQDRITKEHLVLSHNGEYRRRFTASGHLGYAGMYERGMVYNN